MSDFSEVEERSSIVYDLEIPEQCPECLGKLVIVIIPRTFALKPRQHRCCTECDFEESVDDFKKRLLTI